MNSKKTILSFFSFLAICLTIEFLAAWWTQSSVKTWYPLLDKPTWTPPNWAFAPVWTILYLLIATAGWLIYRSPNSIWRTRALIFYGVQLTLNLIWSFLFFGLHNPLLGLVDILLLLFFIVITMYAAWFVDRKASLLFIPYLLWISLATSLNAKILQLN